MRSFAGTLAASATCALLAAPASAEEIPQRDDMEMNSIGGGEFREYVLEYISEGEAFYRPMRTFGTVHNVMHQMMTELAAYARDVREDAHVPDFDDRMSGSDWSDYREALEEAGEEGAWKDLVHVIEVMHDRVHHAMYKAVVHDHQSMGRDSELSDYVRDPEDTSEDELIPERDEIDAAYLGLESFRTLIWEKEPQSRHWRAVIQNAMAFAHLKEQLTQQWVQYGTDHMTGACQPQSAGYYISSEEWENFMAQVAECEDESWRHLMQTHDLAQLRVHQALDHLASLHLEE